LSHFGLGVRVLIGGDKRKNMQIDRWRCLFIAATSEADKAQVLDGGEIFETFPASSGF
jgi:hypothetical protein